MPRNAVHAQLYEAIGPYSHAARSGSHLFISGTLGVNPATGQLAGEDVFSQTTQILENFAACLRAEKATFDDILHVQVNLIETSDFQEMNRAYAAYFREPFPARTVVVVAALPKPKARLTMNALAIVSDKG